ncbi:MAG: serine/threonine-protein kinase [Myxococcaceae bacterium]
MDPGKTIEIPSRRFGSYKVRSRLGSGGMAEVFLAEAVDERGDQVHVALKLMKDGHDEGAFAGEADLMGLLSHPNLVQRLEVGEAFGRPFIAMEFLIGGDLRQVMEAHRRQASELPVPMAVHVLIEVLKALAYFHQARTRAGTCLDLVHGDVNPANVFFSGTGDVKLGDFGVAKGHRGALGPGEGVAAGKLHYLSPEQTRGEPLTPASDVFAVGIMLHELVVGYHPFQVKGAEPAAVMAAIRTAKLALPSYVDRPLALVLSRALAPDLKARYRSAGEFAGDLFRFTLDANLARTPKDVQQWLEGALELLV